MGSMFSGYRWQVLARSANCIADAQSIFVLPPSLPILEQRLIGRGQDSEEVIAKRMAQAVSEMSHYPEYDYLIINDDFELALQQLQSIVLAGRAKLRPQVICHADLLNQLLAG